MPLASLLDVIRLQKDLDKKCNKLITDAPWESDLAAKLDAETIEAWLDRFMYSKFGKQFYKLIAEEAFCGELNEFSMLDLVWGLACESKRKDNKGPFKVTENISSNYYGAVCPLAAAPLALSYWAD